MIFKNISEIENTRLKAYKFYELGPHQKDPVHATTFKRVQGSSGVANGKQMSLGSAAGYEVSLPNQAKKFVSTKKKLIDLLKNR